ncbi:MAG: SpoIID/LytB domain-containing protein [bacterium]
MRSRVARYLFLLLMFAVFSMKSLPLYADENIIYAELLKAHNLYFAGEPESALQQYQKILTIDPYNFEAQVNIGILYRDINLYNNSIEAYKKALAIEKEAFLFSLLGWAYYNSGRLPEAEDAFMQTLGLTTPNKNPSLVADTHYGLGRIYYDLEDYAYAEKSLQTAIDIKVNYAVAYFILGAVYEKMEDPKKALQAYNNVLKHDYNFAEVRFNLARLYMQEEDYEEAFKQYKKISNFDPANKEAKTKKEEILLALAKTEEEIIPPRRLQKHRFVSPAPNRDKILKLRIGIGVNSAGKPIPKDRIRFKCSGYFSMRKKSTGETLFGGAPDDIWTILKKGGSYVVVDIDGNELPLDEPVIIALNNPATNTFILQDIGYGKGFPWGGEEDREYRGEIELSFSDERGIQIVNIVNVEEYLYSVLPSEMTTSWPNEALKAQAVIARGEAMYKKEYTRPHKELDYDLCDDQHCQVYRGVKNEDQRSIKAVNETRGEVLKFDAKIAHTLYSSNCGGHTQSSSELKGWGTVAYLTGVLDAPETTEAPYSPYTVEKWIKTKPDVYGNLPEFVYGAEFRWVNIIKREDLQKRVDRDYDIGTITALIPLKRSKSGHVNAIKIKGSAGEVIIEKEHVIRRVLSSGFLRSNLFIVETKSGANNIPEEFTIYGGGWGHGVGMCQTGAAGLAYKENRNYEYILKHYYKGTYLYKMQY